MQIPLPQLGVNKLDLKSILKSLKLNESSISMVLGAVVVVVVGVLVVNYFREKKSGEILTPVTTETPTSGKTYTVAKGDNLWKISEKAYGSGYNWVDIAKENKLTNPGQIEVGQKLAIPQVSAKKPTTTKTVVSQPKEAISGATYTVVKGDNLWKIALRAYGDGYQWVKISRENKLVHPNLIHSGNVLTIPR